MRFKGRIKPQNKMNFLGTLTKNIPYGEMVLGLPFYCIIVTTVKLCGMHMQNKCMILICPISGLYRLGSVLHIKYSM